MTKDNLVITVVNQTYQIETPHGRVSSPSLKAMEFIAELMENTNKTPKPPLVTPFDCGTDYRSIITDIQENPIFQKQATWILKKVVDSMRVGEGICHAVLRACSDAYPYTTGRLILYFSASTDNYHEGYEKWLEIKGYGSEQKDRIHLSRLHWVEQVLNYINE